MDVKLLLDARATIGESPTWVPEEQAIYWIDVKAPALHRLTLASGQMRDWRLPADIGAFALANGRANAVVALRTGLFQLALDTGTVTRLAKPFYDPTLHRFNEGACDSQGRFWIGTMFDPERGGEREPERASLCSFTFAGGLRRETDQAELHNGMAWSESESVFYLAHSRIHTVYAFPFDAARGELGTPRSFVTTPLSLGVPDGAALDAEDCYWCALHGGWRLHRYRPDGTLDREVMLPVSQPTMCAFVGPDLDQMVVTSATDKLSPEQRAREPHAGSLFLFRPGVRGVPRHYEVR